MEIDDWAQRWKAGRIGFHEGRPNAFLVKHVERIAPHVERRRILVPLCGKAEDLAFLAARGNEVVGIEAVEEGARAFFSEHGLEPEVKAVGPGRSYRAAVGEGSVEIVAADLFACTPAEVGVSAVLYDRAALVALPPDLRGRYTAHLRTLVAAGATGIVVTFEYDQARIDGPPFSTPEAALRASWGAAAVEALDAGPGENPRFKALGIEATEHCYLVRLGENGGG